MQGVGEPSNAVISGVFEEVADLLQAQHADEYRVRAWRRAASLIAGHAVPLGELYRGEGIAGLEAMPGIGYRLARAVVEVLRTGTSSALERLRGDVRAAEVLTTVHGIAEVLAERIHHELGISTLEELRDAADDGRLARVKGIGPGRVERLQLSIQERLSNSQHAAAGAPSPHMPPPSVATLLEVDLVYRRRAADRTLPRIAPKRHNPTRDAWLPILHLEREGWSFSALFSNTALAHQLHKTSDWVVLHYEHDHVHGQATVVTEWRGTLAGRRVVRGHEAQCRAHYREHAAKARLVGGTRRDVASENLVNDGQ